MAGRVGTLTGQPSAETSEIYATEETLVLTERLRVACVCEESVARRTIELALAYAPAHIVVEVLDVACGIGNVKTLDVLGWINDRASLKGYFCPDLVELWYETRA